MKSPSAHEQAPPAPAVHLYSREELIRRQLVSGLTKIGIATRQRAWAGGESSGLTPTQGQALVVLLQREPSYVRLTELAAALAISQPSASVTVRSLIDKGLVHRGPVADDRRAVALSLTERGRVEAARAMTWSDFLIEAVDVLDEAEQAVFLRSIVKMIRSMQEKGQVPVSRMCASCTYFRANRYPGSELPHHCAYVDAPFSDRELRIDCAEFEPAAADLARENWKLFNPGT